MPEATTAMRWSIETRLEFIEFRLFWDGVLNRADIVEKFGVSVPQASNDLSRYLEIAPANAVYDRSRKTYVATDAFAPVFAPPSADRYLNQLRSIGNEVLTPKETWLDFVPEFEALPMPRRRVGPETLRRLLRAIRFGRSIEIEYQSMSTPDPVWRRISPHALAFDGMRWHTRAFCHRDRIFKDFLLPRFLDLGADGVGEIEAGLDQAWSEMVDVELCPHPKLSTGQKRAVALDFGMNDESLKVPVRLALLYYFLRRLNLDPEAVERKPREQHVVLADKRTVFAALDRSQRQTPIAA